MNQRHNKHHMFDDSCARMSNVEKHFNQLDNDIPVRRKTFQST